MLLTTMLIEALKTPSFFAGQIIIVHTSMKAFGAYIVGAEQAIIHALMSIITADGTLIMPSHSTDNTNQST